MKEETKQKSAVAYHVVAIALVVVGFVANSLVKGSGDINGINQVYLAVNELWWMGLAGIVELIALVERK